VKEREREREREGDREKERKKENNNSTVDHRLIRLLLECQGNKRRENLGTVGHNYNDTQCDDLIRSNILSHSTLNVLRVPIQGCNRIINYLVLYDTKKNRL